MSNKPTRSSSQSWLLKTQLRRRLVFVYLPIVLLPVIGYLLWHPGKLVNDGRFDLKQNGIWIGHGYLGDDGWFEKYNKQDQLKDYRGADAFFKLLKPLQRHHITDLFPHLCPATPGGELPGMDPKQSTLFLGLAKANGLSVMPWVGGVYQKHCFPAQKSWRDHFVQSIVSRLTEFPQLDGIQLNIEPWPNGNRDLLNLLDELNAAIPEHKMLSIAAYPPPTRWQPAPEVHWDQTYYQQVAQRADQMVIMMYDTGIKYAKPYELLMRQWTREVLTWGAPTPTLLGVPAYDDAGVPWHDPKVENLHHALRGIHAGLADMNDMQRANYRGISVYCHWEMNDEKWQTLEKEFCK